MKKIIGLFFITLLLIVAVACSKESAQGTKDKAEPNQWQEIVEKGEIVVGTSGTLIAASYYEDDEEEDSLTGYDVEVMREVAKRLDLDIKFEIMGIDSMLPAIKSGRIDVAANDIEVTEKRKEEFNFSDPYKYSYTTMAVRSDDNSGIESLEDLKGKRAGGDRKSVV